MLSRALLEWGRRPHSTIYRLDPQPGLVLSVIGAHLPTLLQGSGVRAPPPAGQRASGARTAAGHSCTACPPPQSSSWTTQSPRQPTWSSQRHSQSRWSGASGQRRLFCSTTEGAACNAPAAYHIGTGWTCRVCTNPAVGGKQQTASRSRQNGSRVRHCGPQAPQWAPQLGSSVSRPPADAAWAYSAGWRCCFARFSPGCIQLKLL